MFLLILVLFLLVGGALTVLTIQNFSSQVHLTVFLWSTPAIPVGLLLIFAFLLGAVLLYIVSVVSALHDKREMTKLRNRITELEQQVTANQSNPPVSFPVTPPQIIPMPGMTSPLQPPNTGGSYSNSSASGPLQG